MATSVYAKLTIAMPGKVNKKISSNHKGLADSAQKNTQRTNLSSKRNFLAPKNESC